MIGKKEYEEIRNSNIYNLIIENNELEASYKTFKDEVINFYNESFKI